jgi:muramidase (phage lysozyme)
MPRISPKVFGQNICAFLDMIAYAEGTARLGDDGYNVIVGGALFDDYRDHPRVIVNLPKLKIKSSAAGRYQLLSRYFDVYRDALGLSDFSPLAQDKIAIQQIKERRALTLIQQGPFEAAVQRVRNIWASLPGAGYGQREHDLEALLDVYIDAGGALA